MENIHPWKFPIYCSLNIFQIGANCKKFDVTNQTECPIKGVYIFLGFKIFLNKSYGIKKIIPEWVQEQQSFPIISKLWFFREEMILWGKNYWSFRRERKKFIFLQAGLDSLQKCKSITFSPRLQFNHNSPKRVSTLEDL